MQIECQVLDNTLHNADWILSLPDLHELLKNITSLYLFNNVIIVFTKSGSSAWGIHVIQLKSLRIVNADSPILGWRGSWVSYMLLCFAVAPTNLNLSELFIEFEYIKLRNLKTKFRQSACSLLNCGILYSLNYLIKNWFQKSSLYSPVLFSPMYFFNPPF